MRTTNFAMQATIGFIAICILGNGNAALAQPDAGPLQTMPRYSTRLNTSLPADQSAQTPDGIMVWSQIPGLFRDFVPHPTNLKIRFAIGQDEAMYRSDTAGESWTKIEAPFEGRVAQLAIATGGDDTLYALGDGLLLARSADLGMKWELVGKGIESGDSSPAARLLIDPRQPEHLFAAGQRIWESWDGGKTFAQFQGADGDGFYTALALDRGDLLAAAAGGSILRISSGSIVHVSTPRNGEISVLVADEERPGTIYAGYATPKRGEQEAQVYLSSDGGHNWMARDGMAPEQLPGGSVKALAIEPGEPGRLYLAMDSGVMVSLNGGTTWLREQSGFDGATGLALQAADSQLNVTAWTPGGLSFAAATSSSCKFTISPGSQEFMAEGGTGTVTVKASASNCAWSVSEGYSWITVVNGSSGKGNGTVSYRVALNDTGKSRQTFSMTIGGQPYTVKQGAKFYCTYTFAPNKAVFPSAGGSGTFAIQTPAGCSWKLKANGATQLNSAASGTGPATVAYTVGKNTRSADIQYSTIDLTGTDPGFPYSFSVLVDVPSKWDPPTTNPGPNPGNGNTGGGNGGGLQPPPNTPVTTAVTTAGINAQVGQSLTIAWSLIETVSRRSVSGWVTIQINGVSVCYTSATQCKYVLAPALYAPGSYTIRANFAGQGVYQPSSTTAVLNVRKADTSLQLSFCAQSPTGGSSIVGPCPYSTTSKFSATLKRAVDNTALAGRTVRFFYNGTQVGSSVTNAAGLAEVRVRLNLDPRLAANRVMAVFDGDTQHLGTTKEAVLSSSGAI